MKFKKGHKINIGRKFSEKHRLKIGLANKGKKRTEEQNKRNSFTHKGKKYPIERCLKMKEVFSGQKNPMFGRKQSEKARQLIREKAIGRKRSLDSRKKQSESMIHSKKRKYKDTDIELKIEEELKKRKINYDKQVPLCKVALVDFYLPEHRIAIQCDGDYWHHYPVGKEKDVKQDKILTFNGFSVYRFWGSEINESASECINKIKIL